MVRILDLNSRPIGAPGSNLEFVFIYFGKNEVGLTNWNITWPFFYITIARKGKTQGTEHIDLDIRDPKQFEPIITIPIPNSSYSAILFVDTYSSVNSFFLSLNNILR